MGNGWHEWPLVLFTVLGQCVAGGVIGTGRHLVGRLLDPLHVAARLGVAPVGAKRLIPGLILEPLRQQGGIGEIQHPIPHATLFAVRWREKDRISR